MNKKILFLSSLTMMPAPLAMVIACGSSSSTRNQIISIETQNKIKNALKNIKPLYFKDNVAGRDINLIDSLVVQSEVDKYTSWVKVDSIILYKQDKVTKQEEIVVTSSSPKPKFELDHIYRIEYLLRPTSKSKWEGFDKPDEIQKFIMPDEIVIDSEKILDINDFKDLEFTNSNDILKYGIYIDELKVDNSSWIDKVDFKVVSAEVAPIGTNNWNNAPLDSTVRNGYKIRAKVSVIPLGKYAWKTGDPFAVNTDGSTMDIAVQWKIDPIDFAIKYPNLITSQEIEINGFYGFFSDLSNKIPGEGWIEMYQRTSNTIESAEPDSFSDYGNEFYKSPPTYNPEINEIYMSIKTQASLPPSPKKYVNFKLMYKDFFKAVTSLPFKLFDRKYLEVQLPYVDKNNYSKIVKENDDLVVYTYSMPYSIF